MNIIYKTGDITKAPEYIIAHGCNAQGKMQSGVAKAIRDAFPEAYGAYKTHCEINKKRALDILGTTAWVVTNYNVTGKERMVANMVTQRYYGRDPETVYVDYDAVRRCMSQMNKKAKLYTKAPYEVAMPMIGAGLGNGDWDIIEQIIREESSDFQPVVYRL